MSYDRSGGRKRPDTQECEITMMAHKTKVPLSLVWRIMVRKVGGDADTDLAQGGNLSTGMQTSKPRDAGTRSTVREATHYWRLARPQPVASVAWSPIQSVRPDGQDRPARRSTARARSASVGWWRPVGGTSLDCKADLRFEHEMCINRGRPPRRDHTLF